MKKILLFLIAAFVIIQFFRPEKNISEASDVLKNDIATLYPVPNDVKKILQTSCYDCHSNNTTYPWYSNFQPVAWWLNHHVTDGKKHLNFNEFTSYRINRQFKKLEEIVDEVKENEMPLSSYTLMHSEAKLDDAQKKLLMNWASSLRDSIKAKYPADSLLKK
ncbi:heme-binding domain-containing protein [Ferruginibacter sp. SUN002]|uniref:heme-binding domain-containing protein n=1 Tax=Ferruginibacter sp. SUN002 TaxID=2937789 RepID=UPI003D362C84